MDVSKLSNAVYGEIINENSIWKLLCLKYLWLNNHWQSNATQRDYLSRRVGSSSYKTKSSYQQIAFLNTPPALYFGNRDFRMGAFTNNRLDGIIRQLHGIFVGYQCQLYVDGIIVDINRVPNDPCKFIRSCIALFTMRLSAHIAINFPRERDILTNKQTNKQNGSGYNWPCHANAHARPRCRIIQFRIKRKT